MNRRVGQQLAAAGWTRQQTDGSQYWSTAVYQHVGV
ncbi:MULTISPECIES: phosphoglycerate mutase [unclassified Pseudomonas]|nr:MULTISPECIES: phosphoglycerate mutase [unclassified Pseudomonas]